MNFSKFPKIAKRHILVAWLFTGFVNAYILRTSINVAIGAMVNDTNVDQNGTVITIYNDTCPYPQAENTTTPPRQGEFNWDHATQGVILSAFYYGYISTQFLGGYLARQVGARFLFGLSIGGTGAVTLLNPVAARISPDFLIALRVLEGFLEGVTYPCCHYLMGNWAPKQERSRMVVFSFTGIHIGTIIAAPLTGVLCQYGFDGGWASSFYIFGAISVLWSIGWIYFVRDTPAQHPTISPEERKYIEENCQSTSRPVSLQDVPWKAMFLSPAVWAVTVGNTAHNWNFYTLLTEMSTYLKDILHINATLNGITTSIPYVCLFFVQLFASSLADFLREKGLATKTVRKLSYCGGMTLSAVCLIVISYVGCDVTTVICLLCLSVGISGFGLCGYVVNHVDISPQYASVLMGITNTFGTLPGIVSPIVAGTITNEASTITTWRTVFFISAGFSVFGAIFFAIFAEGEVQPWAAVDNTADSEVTNLLKSGDTLLSSSQPRFYSSVKERSHGVAETSLAKEAVTQQQSN